MPVNPNLSGGANSHKYSINLLQAELLPEKVLLTLSRVVLVLSLVLVCYGGLGGSNALHTTVS